MRSFLLILIAALWLAQQVPAQHGTIDADEALFTLMAAINAAGYDAGIDSPTNHPIRAQIRQHLASRRLESVKALREFYASHTTRRSLGDLSQYISYALVCNGPPLFDFDSLTYELPPDVQRLKELGPLLAEFYREADIPALYQQIQPAIDEIAAQYQPAVVGSLFEINGYLKNPTSGVSGRSFRIVISLLAAPNQIQTRSYRSNYFVVVSPSTKPQISDIRYTYLHYVLEPVVSRARENLERIQALGDYALGAPHLPDHYKQDFQLLATTSLVKAVEARLSKQPDAVGQAYRQGYILTPYFWEQLPAYEAQELAMRFYFEEMVDNLDLVREEARSRDLEFEQTEQVRRVKTAAPPEPELSAAEKTLEEGEERYRAKDIEGARELFLRAIRESSQKAVSSRGYYGLARIATLNNEAELAMSLFEKALELGPENREKGWILYYLGRLSDAFGEPGKAREYYDAALAVEGITSQVQDLATQGAAGAYQPASSIE